jgi:hypothetical protein
MLLVRLLKIPKKASNHHKRQISGMPKILSTRLLAYQPSLASKSVSIIASLVFQNSYLLMDGIVKFTEYSVFFQFCRWTKQLWP